MRLSNKLIGLLEGQIPDIVPTVLLNYVEHGIIKSIAQPQFHLAQFIRHDDLAAHLNLQNKYLFNQINLLKHKSNIVWVHVPRQQFDSQLP